MGSREHHIAMEQRVVKFGNSILPGDEFKCLVDTCEEIPRFKSSREIKEHIHKVHKPKYKCNFCKKKFQTRKNLKEHRRLRSNCKIKETKIKQQFKNLARKLSNDVDDEQECMEICSVGTYSTSGSSSGPGSEDEFDKNQDLDNIIKIKEEEDNIEEAYIPKDPGGIKIKLSRHQEQLQLVETSEAFKKCKNSANGCSKSAPKDRIVLHEHICSWTSVKSESHSKTTIGYMSRKLSRTLENKSKFVPFNNAFMDIGLQFLFKDQNGHIKIESCNSRTKFNNINYTIVIYDPWQNILKVRGNSMNNCHLIPLKEDNIIKYKITLF